MTRKKISKAPVSAMAMVHAIEGSGERDSQIGGDCRIDPPVAPGQAMNATRQQDARQRFRLRGFSVKCPA